MFLITYMQKYAFLQINLYISVYSDVRQNIFLLIVIIINCDNINCDNNSDSPRLYIRSSLQ